jgi:hypothetical protein
MDIQLSSGLVETGMIENVFIDDLHCALILRAAYRENGIQFFTKDEDSLQLGYMQREQGYLIRPHAHREVVRRVGFTHEVLFIKSGRVKVNFFDKSDALRQQRILEPGDTALLMEGGHGFEMLETSEIIEVKQGPYVGEEDKYRF